MFKLCGAAVAAIAVFAAAWLKLQQKRSNKLLLSAMCAVCKKTADEIRYKNTELFSVFKNLAQDKDGAAVGFFADLCDVCGDGFDLKGVSSVISCHIGDPEQVGLITDFIAGLGKSDTDGQIRHCKMYGERFGQLYIKAEEKYNSEKRVCLAVGGYMSAAVFILLI